MTAREYDAKLEQIREKLIEKKINRLDDYRYLKSKKPTPYMDMVLEEYEEVFKKQKEEKKHQKAALVQLLKYMGKLKKNQHIMKDNMKNIIYDQKTIN